MKKAMKSIRKWLVPAGLCLILGAGMPLVAASKTDQLEKITEAKAAFEELMSGPDDGIPEELLRKAHCAVIVPGLKKGAFMVGGHYGEGVMFCREGDGPGWNGPSMVRMEGGSFGFQIGGSATDVFLLAMDERGSQKLMSSEFTLGGEAGVAAGPVGREASAKTDAMMHAEILAWSRSRGVFAGLSVEGSTLRASQDDNSALYGRQVKHKAILNGDVGPHPASADLRETLNRYAVVESD